MLKHALASLALLTAATPCPAQSADPSIQVMDLQTALRNSNSCDRSYAQKAMQVGVANVGDTDTSFAIDMLALTYVELECPEQAIELFRFVLAGAPRETNVQLMANAGLLDAFRLRRELAAKGRRP